MDAIIKFITMKQVYGLVIIVVVAYVLYKIFNAVLNKIIEKGKSVLEKKRRKTVIQLFKNVIKYGVMIIALIFILDLYGVNVSSLVASLGVASAVGALAFQDTLKDIIGGSTIIMENYYMVGDYVTYNNFTGKIIQMTLRSTKIQDFDGQILTISNRNITQITNLSQTVASSLISIPTAYEEKTDKVEKILNEVVDEMKTWPTMDNETTAYIGILELADSCVKYGIRFYCSPGNVWQYKREALRLVKAKYDKNNIKIPYNQIEVHNAKK